MQKLGKTALTSNLSNSQVVALAVFILGGEERAVDTEDVAIKVNELSPGRFTWTKYPDQINLELVRVYLSDAKKESHGSLLSGSGKEGWTLTPNGRRWAARTWQRLPSVNLSMKRSDQERGSVDARRIQRERKRILGSSAWLSWTRGEATFPVAHSNSVFRIDSYATERTRSLKINRLLRMFEGDLEISPFLEALSLVLTHDPESRK